MRTNTELTLIGLAAVQIAFFSWPVPKIVTDIFHTGIGRFVGLLGVAQLAKQQSAALAILAAIFQARATQAAQNENFTVPKPEEKKEEKKEKKEEEAIPPATSGNVAASAGSSASAQPASSGVTENFEPFSGF